MRKRSAKIFFAGIIALGLLIRVGYLIEIVPHPNFTRPGIDPAYYDYWARAIVTGDWTVELMTSDPEIPDHPYFKPPGYPFFLALVYLFSSGSYLAPRLVQMILGLGAVILVFLAGRKYFGDLAALIWAFLLAVYWIFIYYEGELLETAPVNLLFLGGFFWLLLWSSSPRPLWSALAGLALGASALMRPNFLALPLAVLPWQFWVLRRMERSRAFLPSAGVFLLAILLPIVPVTIRNYVVSGEFVPIATYGGINLHLGNQHSSAPILTHGSLITGDWSSFDYPRLVRRLEQEEGQPLTHAEASSLLAGRGWSWIRQHPMRFIGRLGEKFLLFWGPREVSNNREVEFDRLNSPLLSALPGSFSLILALAIVGAGLWWSSDRKRGSSFPRWRAFTLLLSLIAVLSLTFLPFVAAALYRVPVIPFLLLAGAVGIDCFIDTVRRRKWKTLIATLLALAAFSFLTRLNPTGYHPRQERWYYDQALVFSEAGEDEEALRFYGLAIAEKAEFADAYNNRGNIRRKQRRFEEAVADYNQALAVRPDYDKAYNNRGLAYLEGLADFERARADFDRALALEPENMSAHYNRGNLFLQLGEFPRALADYNRALELSPQYSQAYNNRGNALSSLGIYGPARADYDQAILYDPGNAEAYYNRAKFFLTTGDYHQAIEDSTRALKLRPDCPDTLVNRGVAHYLQGGYSLARDDFLRALEVDPDYVGAHYNLAIVWEALGEDEAALKSYHQAIELNPNQADYYSRRAELFRRLGLQAQAEADLRESERLGRLTDGGDL